MSYRFMRLLLMFDLPTETVENRKNYRQFRKFLINEGFIMHQFSVYSKILLNNNAKEAMTKRIRDNAPSEGLITLLSVTEKQFAKMIYISGEIDSSVANTEQRLIILGEGFDEN